MDLSVLADRDCLVAFAAVVLCSDRGVQAHKMGCDYGGIAHLTAKGAAGQTGLSQAASARALRRLEEAGLIISDGDGDAWRTSAGIFARDGDRSPEPGQDIVPETAGSETEIVEAMPGKPVAALMEQFGMTEADVLALAMSSPAEDFSLPDEVYVGGRRVPRQELLPLKKSATTTVHTVKASLHEAKPPVWRRLELSSDLSLDMVHEVLQIAFAWHGYHLHQFETACGAFGRPDDDGDWGFEEAGDESAVALAQVAAEEKAKIVYVYDFGDDWRHDIVVEKITPALPGVAYPRCTGGRGWAPEEDSGGIWARNEAVAAVGLVMPFTPTALGALSKLANPT
jgi:DNA-binding transcriptional ArsR family regulator